MDLMYTMLVVTSILLSVAGHGWTLFAQHPSAITISSTAAAVPPNCNCSLFTSPSGPPPPPPPPRTTGSGRPAPGAHPPPPPPPHPPICGNDKRNYSNPCEFINAQARNSTLGGRLCPKEDDIYWLEHALSHDHNEFEREMEPDEEEADDEGEEEEPACFTDGHTAASGHAAATYLRDNPRVGLRCGGPCPCTLTCPLPHHPAMPEDHHTRNKRNAGNGHLNGHLNPEKHAHSNGHLSNHEKHPVARRKRNTGHLSGEKHLGGGHRDSHNPTNGGGHGLTGHGTTGDHH